MVKDFQYFKRRFPKLFGKMNDATMFYLPVGWTDLFIELCQDIKDEVFLKKGVELIQVKEKFGILRVYADAPIEFDRIRIAQAETASSYLCQVCGKQDVELVTTGDAWKTVCNLHK